MSPKTRSLLVNLLRVGISAGLLTWVLSTIKLETLAATLRAADLRPYGLALGLGLTGIVLRAWRWQVLLHAVGARLPFRRLVYLYFIGAFFNTFLPTGFGGDVVRVLEAGGEADRAQVAGTTVVDRLTGFLMLFALALAALPFAGGLLTPALTGAIAAGGLGLLAGSALLFEGRLLRWIAGRLPLPQALSLTGDGWLARMYAAITACGRGALLRALGVSLIFNLTLLTAGLLIARAFQIAAPAAALFVIVPVATVSLLLPSISGLGVREQAYVLLFAQLGVGTEQALAFSLAYYSLDLTAGLVGGLIYLVSGLLRLRS